MRKTFKLSHPKIKPARVVDSIKFEVKKYFKRERNKKLPEGSDFWDFDCRFGATAEKAEVIDESEIKKRIDEAHRQELDSFYLEILARAAVKEKREELEE